MSTSDTIQQNMLELAQAAQSKAYAPYSTFYVGACILADDDQFYLGCNVENISYGLTLCAEATAISQMVIAGRHKIKEITIIGSSDVFCSPCGACRQRIAEFAELSTLVHFYNAKAECQTMTMEALLPQPFLPSTLGIL